MSVLPSGKVSERYHTYYLTEKQQINLVTALERKAAEICFGRISGAEIHCNPGQAVQSEMNQQKL